MSSQWILLILAGLLEVCWAIGLKYSERFTRLVPSIFTLITLAGSMFLLAKAAQAIPNGCVYLVRNDECSQRLFSSLFQVVETYHKEYPWRKSGSRNIVAIGPMAGVDRRRGETITAS